jgi:hypothetical protein
MTKMVRRGNAAEQDKPSHRVPPLRMRMVLKPLPVSGVEVLLSVYLIVRTADARQVSGTLTLGQTLVWCPLCRAMEGMGIIGVRRLCSGTCGSSST